MASRPQRSLKHEYELYVDRDIMVLANPEIARLPGWVIALVVVGALVLRLGWQVLTGGWEARLAAIARGADSRGANDAKTSGLSSTGA